MLKRPPKEFDENTWLNVHGLSIFIVVALLLLFFCALRFRRRAAHNGDRTSSRLIVFGLLTED